jgi:hypothetical protein
VQQKLRFLHKFCGELVKNAAFTNCVQQKLRFLHSICVNLVKNATSAATAAKVTPPPQILWRAGKKCCLQQLCVAKVTLPPQYLCQLGKKCDICSNCV